MHTDTQMKNSYDLSTTFRDHFQKLPGFYIPSTERFECSDHGIFDLNMSHLILCLVRWTAYSIVSKFA